MAKVSVVTRDKVREAQPPSGISGDARTEAYLDGVKDPLHLYLHRLAKGASLAIGPLPVDCVAYIWSGKVEAGGQAMAAGSSLAVEHGKSVDIEGLSDESVVLTFSAAQAPDTQRAGGHVHLLPVARVPRAAELSGASGVGGGMHFDSGCETCEVWLHENHFPGAEPMTPEEEARGVHCHSEDEVIFVIDGQMRLGQKLVGPGTALAIAADTMYSFTPGPEGLSFINFRAATPGDIQFANGMAISETGYWKDKLPRPEYIEAG
ncbi:MAG: hypothetical protein KDE55_23975 [Novosphingobium sp.]|nr:hypothetical protein [Novosphingobium sp.]